MATLKRDVQKLIASPACAPHFRHCPRRELRGHLWDGPHLQQPFEPARCGERRRAVRARYEVFGDSAVWRQFPCGDRLHRIERFIAKHTSSLEVCFEQPAQLLLRAMQLCLHGAERDVQRFRKILGTARRRGNAPPRRDDSSPAAARSLSPADRAVLYLRIGDRRPTASPALAPPHRPMTRPRRTQRLPAASGFAGTRWRRCDRSMWRGALRRGNTASRGESGETRPAPGLPRESGLAPSGRSTRTRVPCTPRPAPETRLRRRGGSARRARARWQAPFAIVLEHAQRQNVSVHPS